MTDKELFYLIFNIYDFVISRLQKQTLNPVSMSVTDPWSKWERRNAEKERKRRKRRCFPFQINLALPPPPPSPHGLHCLCGMCTYTCTHSRQDTSKWGGGLRKRPLLPFSPANVHKCTGEKCASNRKTKEATKVQGTKEKNNALLDRTNRTRMGGVVGAATVIVQRRRDRTFPSLSFFGVSFGLGGLTPEA